MTHDGMIMASVGLELFDEMCGRGFKYHQKLVGFYENRQNPVGIGFASSSKTDLLNLKISKILK
jgi:hypothetical protein